MKTFIKRHKASFIAIADVLAFTLVIASIGAFGPVAMPIARLVLMFILKWCAIAFGYFLVVFLPFRISSALKRRDEAAAAIIERNKKIIQHNKQIQQKDKEKALEEKILEAFYKEEDEV